MKKRVLIYSIGLFLLALGVGFSIQADLGVSPVSSLPYALALIVPWSVGTMTFVANMLYILLQKLLGTTVTWKDWCVQIIISLVFAVFMDSALAIITTILPPAQGYVMRFFYVGISLMIIACALLFYFTAKLPLLAYDGLTYAISERFSIPFSKAKISGDLMNVAVSVIICLFYLRSLGSIGIGTFIVAYGIGKIAGIFLKRWQPRVIAWMER